MIKLNLPFLFWKYLRVMMIGSTVICCPNFGHAQVINDDFDILLVGTTTSTADILTKDSLVSWGYRVNLVDGADYANEDHADYSLVYISESISSSDAVPYGEAGFPIPCFLAEPYALNKPGIRLGALVTAQTANSEDMEIVDDFSQIVRHYWTAGQEVKIFEYSDEIAAAWPDGIFQYEVNLEDIDIAASVSYIALGKPINSTTDVPYTGLPSWVLIDAGSINGDGVFLQSEIVIHAFQQGSSEAGTEDYWTQVRRSVQYLKADFPSCRCTPFTSTDPEVKLSIYPNPASIHALLEYFLEKEGPVEITVLNLNGQLVKTIDTGFRSSGLNKELINVSSLANGIYFLQIKGRGFDHRAKLLIDN